MTHPLFEGTREFVRRFRTERRARTSLTSEEFLDGQHESAVCPAGIAHSQWIELLDVLRNAPESEVDALIAEWLERNSLGASAAMPQTLPLQQEPDATRPGPTPPPAQDAQCIDRRYRIVRVLGEGAFGKVFLVEDKLQNDQELALKLIKKEHTATSEALMRFKNEILLLRVLNHPGIPQIFNDGISEDGEFYYTMAYVSGRTLDDVIRKQAPLEPTRIVRITKQILDVLDYAHSRGAIHRDLKPGNIFLVHPGTPKEQVRVLDFGIAKVLSREGLLEHAQTMNTEMALGTPHYMSPEQVRGTEVDGRTDLYALGVIIYQMCSGRFPFTGKTLMEILAARLEKPPNPLEDATTPAWLRQVVMKLLEREREHRPDTAAIRVMLDQLQVSHRSISRRLTWISAAVVVIAGVLLWAVFGDKQGQNPFENSGVDPAGEISSGVSPKPPAQGSNAEPIKEASADASGDHGKQVTEQASAITNEGELEGDGTPPGDGNDAQNPAPALEPKPAEVIPSPPPLPAFTLVNFEPASSPRPRVLAQQRTLHVSGRASRPLDSVRIAGVAITLDPKDPTRFEADVTLPAPSGTGGQQEGTIKVELVDSAEHTLVEHMLDYIRYEALLPRDCSPADGASFDERGRVTSIVHDATGIQLALVDDGPGKPGFYLAVYELTHDEWNRGPSKLIRETVIPAAPEDERLVQYPVAGMSFEAAKDFCEQMRLRLPSTSEWERAAALAGHVFPWGDAFEEGACNYQGKQVGASAVAPVGNFPKDRCGPFFDMAGNLQEYCIAAKDAPALRGGGWRSSANACKLMSPGTAPPRGNTAIGFRVALTCER